MLLTQIKKDRMLAMKAKEEKTYESLTTLLSEIQRMDKADQENDGKVQQVITKSIKSLTDDRGRIESVDRGPHPTGGCRIPS
jgi:uncharacterized protein YqeY